jgi:hypothetical protein
VRFALLPPAVRAAAGITGLVAGILLVSVYAGKVTAENPPLAKLGIAWGLLMIYVAVRRELFWWDAFLIALAGSLILDYGFVNISVGFGLPVAEGILFCLLVGILVVRPIAWPALLPFGLALGFIALATLRLLVDFPTWGSAALRDFTLPLEVAFLFVGYWAMRIYGPDRWKRMLKWLFIAALAYFALYPLRGTLVTIGPTVGIQQPVSLLGNYWGVGTAAATGFFFFALVRPFGSASIPLAAGFLPVIALVQERGVYLAVFVASALLLLLAKGRLSLPLRRSLLGAVVVGVIGLVFVFTARPEGRLGTADVGFYTSQVGTLLGRQGPGAGTYRLRLEWKRDLIKRLEDHPSALLVGLGLGPDLTQGVKSQAGILVRKPHDDYLEVLARLGIPGISMLLLLILASALRVARAARAPTNEHAQLLWWIFATAVVYSVVAATQPLLSYPFGTIPLFSALGAGLALCEHRRSVRE